MKMSQDQTKEKTGEATIVIDGITLTSSQAMTLRVAINSFRDDLQHNGLGNDAHGIAMVKGYTKSATEIIHMIHGEINRGLEG